MNNDTGKLAVRILALITFVVICINVFVQEIALYCAAMIFSIGISVGYHKLEMHSTRNCWIICAILAVIGVLISII